MDKEGNLYLGGEDTPEEDLKRAEEWGKEVEEKEIKRRLREIEEVEAGM